MSANKKGLASLQVLIETIMVIAMLVLLITMSFGKSLEERRLLAIHQDTVATKALFAAASRTLDETRKTLAAQAVFGELEKGFGGSRDYYFFNLSKPESFNTSGPRCTDNPAVCVPSQTDLETGIFGRLAMVGLPEASEGEFSGRTKQFNLQWSPINVQINDDGVNVQVSQILGIQGGYTSVDSTTTPASILPISLDGLHRSIITATSGAFQIRKSKAQFISGNEKNQVSTLMRLSSTISSAEGTNMLLSLAPVWMVRDTKLIFGYDANARVIDGQLIGRSGLMNCTGTDITEKEQELYNKFSGAIELADPDILKPYVAKPRALIAGIISAASGWNPNRNKGVANVTNDIVGLMVPVTETTGLGSAAFDPATNIKLGVGRLLRAFNDTSGFGKGNELVKQALSVYFSNTGIASSIAVDKWQKWEKCKPYETSTGMIWPVEGPIVGCYGDSSCSGTMPLTANAALPKNWNHGIDIYAPPGTPVRAALDGRVVDSSTNSISLVHYYMAIDSFRTLYENMKPIGTAGHVKQGQVIGTVMQKPDKNIPALHFEIINPIKRGVTINPCTVLGCSSTTPEKAPYANALTLPIFSSAIDYAKFLSSHNTGYPIRLGREFCDLSDKAYRGWRQLGYTFEREDGSTFHIYAAFGGTVLHDVMPAEDGCGDELWVDSGEFVTIYTGARFSNLGQGKDVGFDAHSDFLGIAAENTLCGKPHITVVFARKTFKLTGGSSKEAPENLNPCGLPTKCVDIAIPPSGTRDFECDLTKPLEDRCKQAGAPRGINPRSVDRSDSIVPSEFYCSALQWESVAGASGNPRFWRLHENRGEWSREPVELHFKMSDRFEALSCSGNRKNRYTWNSPKDLACIDKPVGNASLSPVVCAPNELETGRKIQGIQTAYPGECIGGNWTGNCNNGLWCASVNVSWPVFRREFTGILLDNKRPDDWKPVFEGRTISKFCAPGEENTDWICCKSISGKSLSCNNYDNDALRRGELICTDSSVTCA